MRLLVLLSIAANLGLAEIRFSPDGKFVAVTSDQGLLLSGKGATIAGASNPRFSPDSRRLAFLRDGRIWSMPVSGAEAKPLANDLDVTAFEWSTTVLALERGRLIRLDDRKLLSDPADRITSFAPSSDGKWVVAIHEPGFVFLHNLDRGIATRVLIEETGTPSRIRWARDGFYAAIGSKLVWFDLEEGEQEPVDLDWPAGLGPDFATTRDGFVAVLVDHGRTRLARYPNRRWLDAPHSDRVSEVEVSPDGKRIAWLDHGTWYAAPLKSVTRAKAIGPWMLR